MAGKVLCLLKWQATFFAHTGKQENQPGSSQEDVNLKVRRKRRWETGEEGNPGSTERRLRRRGVKSD